MVAVKAADAPAAGHHPESGGRRRRHRHPEVSGGHSHSAKGWRLDRAEDGRSTKSRRYSTTLGALRRARVAYAVCRRRGDTLPLDVWGCPEDDQAVIVVASWRYLGSGYQTTGEAWLAASAAARAREARRVAKEELRTMTMAAYESARWPGFAAAASTWTRGWSRSWRLSPRSVATSISGPSNQ
jgi:hypothetical protein